MTVAPDRILEIAFAFRKAKVLLSAVELGLFGALADGPLDGAALVRRLQLHGRGAPDFFDALVALGLLERDAGGRYANAPDCACYLDPRRPCYVGGLLDYLNARQYQSWGLLTEALRDGAPRSGPLGSEGFAALYADRPSFEIFLAGMTGSSLLPAQALAREFPWRDYRTVVDIGTAQGCVPVEIALAHPHLTGGGFDLPQVEPAFTRYVRGRGLGGRLSFHPGDFLADPLPRADVLIMGRVLHDWDLATRKLLLAKACEALRPGGALIVWETLIDDERRTRVHGLLASLNMLMQTACGSEFTGAECTGWMRDCGLDATRLVRLTDAYTAVIGVKGGAWSATPGAPGPRTR